MPEDPKSLCEGHWQSKFSHCVPVILWDGAFSICSWLILWMISVLLYGEVGNTCKFLICCQFKESSVTVSLKRHKAVQSGRSPVPAPSTVSSGGFLFTSVHGQESPAGILVQLPCLPSGNWEGARGAVSGKVPVGDLKQRSYVLSLHCSW